MIKMIVKDASITELAIMKKVLEGSGFTFDLTGFILTITTKGE